MFRRRLAHPILLLGGLQLAALGCAKELEITQPVDPAKVVRAQFDPTNPIPVLRLVPTPTALVQDPTTGELDPAQVAPRPCEGASTKQCLAFVNGGWPTTTPITLFFSGDLDETTITDGIMLLELQADGSVSPIPFTATVEPRPTPPEECMDGGNGSDLTYSAEDVPPGNQVVLAPMTALKPSTRYIVLAKSSATGGLKTADKKVVEPSALFHLLNMQKTGADEATWPVHENGHIANALLRSSVAGTILEQAFGGKSEKELTEAEKMAFEAALESSGKSLFGLFTFFSSIVDPLVAAGAVKRSDVVIANAWKTADAGGPQGPYVQFDPAQSIVPFPNTPLLTVQNMDGSLTVNIPNPQNDPTLAGVNTLNGFSTTAPIFIPVSAEPDPSTIDPTGMTPCTADDCNVVMYSLDAEGHVDDANGVPLAIITTPATIVVVPVLPLLQNHGYVVGVKKGIKDLNGAELMATQTFDFLKLPGAFIDAEGNVAETPVNPKGATFKQALQCSTVESTGELASDAQVAGIANALENQVMHQRWLAGFAALESATPAIPRTNVTMAFTYNTEAITNAVDYAKGNLERSTGCTAATPCWDDLLGGQPQVVGPVVDVQGSAAIAATVGVVNTLCVPICQQGAMAPAIPPAQCTADLNALGQHPLCRTAVQLVTSRLDHIRLYLLKTYNGLVGGPYQTTPGHAGTFTPTSLAAPSVSTIPMWVVTGTVSSPASANAKYPIAVFQHGLGSQKEAGFYIANTFASTINAQAPNGWATVMIDLPYHGARASDLVNNTTGVPCPDIDPATVTCDQAGACTGGCDGERDPSGSGFLGINLFATRDNFRQGTIDQLTLLHALRKATQAGGALEYLDGTRIGYVGQSLGGITGGNLSAYLTPSEIESVVLNVPGGGLVYNILLKTVPQISAPLFAGLAARGICELNTPNDPTSGCKETPTFAQFKVIAQWILDPGDPLATSIGVTKTLAPNRTPLGKDNVLIQMSLPDPVVPNDAGYALGRAYGFGTSGNDEHFQIFDFTQIQRPAGSGCHAFLLAPICGQCLFDTVCTTLGAQIQAAQFVASGGTTIAPQKVNVAGIDCSNPCQ